MLKKLITVLLFTISLCKANAQDNYYPPDTLFHGLEDAKKTEKLDDLYDAYTGAMENKDTVQALTYLDSLIAEDGKFLEYHKDKIKINMARRNWEGAIKAINAALKTCAVQDRDEYIKMISDRVVCLLILKKWFPAANDLDYLEGMDSSLENIYLYRAECYKELDFKDDACKDYQHHLQNGGAKNPELESFCK